MKQLRVTVDGKTYDVVVEILDETPAPASPAAAPAPTRAAAPHPASGAPAPARPAAAPAGAIVSPLAGKVISVDVKAGEKVTAGAQVATVEAMKMNTFIYAESEGMVAAVLVSPGDSVEEGAPILQLA